jgi:hypothetical protein
MAVMAALSHDVCISTGVTYSIQGWDGMTYFRCPCVAYADFMHAAEANLHMATMIAGHVLRGEQTLFKCLPKFTVVTPFQPPLTPELHGNEGPDIDDGNDEDDDDDEEEDARETKSEDDNEKGDNEVAVPTIESVGYPLGGVQRLSRYPAKRVHPLRGYPKGRARYRGYPEEEGLEYPDDVNMENTKTTESVENEEFPMKGCSPNTPEDQVDECPNPDAPSERGCEEEKIEPLTGAHPVRPEGAQELLKSKKKKKKRSKKKSPPVAADAAEDMEDSGWKCPKKTADAPPLDDVPSSVPRNGYGVNVTPKPDTAMPVSATPTKSKKGVVVSKKRKTISKRRQSALKEKHENIVLDRYIELARKEKREMETFKLLYHMNISYKLILSYSRHLLESLNTRIMVEYFFHVVQDFVGQSSQTYIDFDECLIWLGGLMEMKDKLLRVQNAYLEFKEFLHYVAYTDLVFVEVLHNVNEYLVFTKKMCDLLFLFCVQLKEICECADLDLRSILQKYEKLEERKEWTQEFFIQHDEHEKFRSLIVDNQAKGNAKQKVAWPRKHYYYRPLDFFVLTNAIWGNVTGICDHCQTLSVTRIIHVPCCLCKQGLCSKCDTVFVRCQNRSSKCYQTKHTLVYLLDPKIQECLQIQADKMILEMQTKQQCDEFAEQKTILTKDGKVMILHTPE